MEYKKKVGKSDQGGKHQIVNVANSANDGVEYATVDTIVERKCPISYVVLFVQYQMVDGETSPRKSGMSETVFHDPDDPFIARQEGFIYGFGLDHIIRNQHKWGGLIFDTKEEAKAKGDRIYNTYSIEIWMENGLNSDNPFPIYRVGTQEPLDFEPEFISELQVLESLGYTTKNIINVYDENGLVHPVINSMVYLMPLTEVNESEKDQARAA